MRGNDVTTVNISCEICQLALPSFYITKFDVDGDQSFTILSASDFEQGKGRIVNTFFRRFKSAYRISKVL